MLNRQLKSNSPVRISAGLLGVAALGGFLGWAQIRCATKGEDRLRTPSTRYYCRLNALNKTEWARLHALAAEVSRARTESKELADGYAFRLRNEQLTLAELGEWTSYVHRCCPFLDYQIAAQKDDALWLTIKGGEAAKPFIRAEYAQLFGH